MRSTLLILGLCVLTGCDERPQPSDTETVALSEQERADNPLLKLQDDTTNKAQESINDALEKQQQALDSIGQ